MAASGSHAKGGTGGESDEAAREALLNEVNALADAMAETKRSLEAERDELAAALAEARAAAAAAATAAAASANTPSGGASADAVSEPMRPRSSRTYLVAPMQVHCECRGCLVRSFTPTAFCFFVHRRNLQEWPTWSKVCVQREHSLALQLRRWLLSSATCEESSRICGRRWKTARRGGGPTRFEMVLSAS